MLNVPGANLYVVDLRGTTLRFADLYSTDLSVVDMTEACLTSKTLN